MVRRRKSLGTNKRNRFDVSPYLFISPVFILLALLVVYPIAYAFYLSVMDTNLTTKWEFVGLSNYISLLKDGSMINSLKVTFLFTIVVVLGHLAVGTILALAMNKKKPGVTVLRTILIIPWLLPDTFVFWNGFPLFLNINLIHFSSCQFKTNLGILPGQ